MNRLLTVAALVLLGLFAFFLSFFTVDEKYSAVVFQFSEAKRIIQKPGIYFKVPFLQEVKRFDRRIQTIDESTPARIQTSEKMNVLADTYIKWQIADVEKYYKAVGLNEMKATERLRSTVNKMLRDEFGKRTVQDVITGKRDEVMRELRKVADADAEAIGVRIVDVRLKRVELETATLNSVYERMRSERKTEANKLRAEGAALADKIRGDADKQKEIVLADAYNKAQSMMGEGDAKAAAIYAAAYGKNPEFYAFYKSMDAYRESFSKKSDVMVLDPSSDFFKYMKNPRAGGAK